MMSFEEVAFVWFAAEAAIRLLFAAELPPPLCDALPWLPELFEVPASWLANMTPDAALKGVWSVEIGVE